MPRLTSSAPVLEEVSRGGDQIRSAEAFSERLLELAKPKPNGLVISNREGITTAKVVALLWRVEDGTLRSELATAVHNDGADRCTVATTSLIKSPCFTADFACFVSRSGVFAALQTDNGSPFAKPVAIGVPVGAVSGVPVLSGEAAVVLSGEAAVMRSGEAAVVAVGHEIE